MRIAITGASGFIGREIIKLAHQQGHEILACSRRPEKPVPGAHRTVKFGPELSTQTVHSPNFWLETAKLGTNQTGDAVTWFRR